MGLSSGLAFSLWIGFGGPKPPISRLSLATDMCFDAMNVTTEMTYQHNFTTITTALPTSIPSVDYFPLYRLSYMWYAPIGFFVTIIVAQIVSRTVTAILSRRGSSRHKVDQQLLSPMFPHCFRTSPQLPDPVLLVFLLDYRVDLSLY